ncbi:MAG: lysophospholipid acyltransferase family protein [Candidatus Hydrogenedentota bacterium]
MPVVRFCWRFTFLVAWSTLLALLYFLDWPFTYTPEARRRRLRRTLLKAFAGGLLRVWGIRVEEHGRPPETPFFLVANHISYIDVLVIMRATGCVFVARGDVESWPVIGFLLRSLHMMFINRANKRDTYRVNKLIQHALACNDGVGVFAESRISRGIDVEPFKSALIQPAVINEIPVHYATITYKARAGARPPHAVISWWLPMPFFAHLCRVLANRGCTAVVWWGDAPIEHEDRKELAHRLHAAVRARFQPVE